MPFFQKINSKFNFVRVFEKSTKGQKMNIKSINGTIGLYQNFGAGKTKSEEKKPTMIGKMVSKVIVASNTNKTTQTCKNPNAQTQRSDKDTFTKEVTSDDDIKITTTRLKSGTVRTDKIKRDIIAGTFIDSDFNPPVNGVAKMEMYKNVTGDISRVTTFDKDGKTLKDIVYHRDFNSFWHNAHKPQSIEITDEQGNVTTIYNDFLNHRPEQIKTITIKTPDGETRKTVVPYSMTDKVKDKAVDLQWKIMQSINGRKHILR